MVFLIFCMYVGVYIIGLLSSSSIRNPVAMRRFVGLRLYIDLDTVGLINRYCIEGK